MIDHFVNVLIDFVYVLIDVSVDAVVDRHFGRCFGTYLDRNLDRNLKDLLIDALVYAFRGNFDRYLILRFPQLRYIGNETSTANICIYVFTNHPTFRKQSKMSTLALLWRIL